MTQARVFKIRGMDCAEEVAVLRQELAPLAGGEQNLGFDLLNGTMSVSVDSAVLSDDAIIAAVRRAGLTAELPSAASLHRASGPSVRSRRLAALTAASGAALCAGFAAHVFASDSLRRALGYGSEEGSHSVPLVAAVLYAASIVIGGAVVIPKAWAAARRLRPDMNILMTVAVCGAVGIGEWLEAATVSFLFALSLALEAWSIGRARRAVQALLDLAPPTARVRRPDGSEAELALAEVAIGSTVIVKPGERVPLDGRILRGATELNQAPLTGESVPVPKAPGDEVLAGTINGEATIEIQTTKTAQDTTLAHVLRLVSEAQRQRSPSEQWVERFARVYTPAVLVAALGVFVVGPLALGWLWKDALYRALVLLVIGCPCALVISTPVSIVAALTSAARHGVLIKGGPFVEAPARIQAMAFDKTGTLTEGRPSVVEFVALSGHNERELLERAAAIESSSSHPVAQAIVSYARSRGVAVRPASGFRMIPGKGGEAAFEGKRFFVGSHRFLEESGQETAEVHRLIEPLTAAGRTIVAVWNETHVCGVVAVADTIRVEAKQALAELKRAGIKSLAMLTGDNRGTAQAVATQLGLDEVQAELLPADKVAAVEALVARHGRVAMVGDGINDAPALARATLSIAMGAGGSDAAIEAADIALMSDNLAKLPWLISHARRTLATIRVNIALSLLVKAVFVVLSLVGYASLWSAIAADMGASLAVVFNGLRLLTDTRPGAGAESGPGSHRDDPSEKA